MTMNTTTAALTDAKTRADLLLQVREGDRIEVLFAANHDAQRHGQSFLRCLYEQVTLYKKDYQRWTQEQMWRYDEEEAERISSAQTAAR